MGSIPSRNTDAYGMEFAARRPVRHERKCIGTGCTATIYAPKVRCKPCQADYIDHVNRESKRRCAARRREEAGTIHRGASCGKSTLLFPVVTK